MKILKVLCCVLIVLCVFVLSCKEPNSNINNNDPGTNQPGTDPGTDPGTNQPGTDPGTAPGTDPGTDPGIDVEINLTIYIEDIAGDEVIWFWEDAAPVNVDNELIVSYGSDTSIVLQLSSNYNYANIAWYINGERIETDDVDEFGVFTFKVKDHFKVFDVDSVCPISVDIEIDNVPYTLNMWIKIEE